LLIVAVYTNNRWYTSLLEDEPMVGRYGGTAGGSAPDVRHFAHCGAGR
jgi:hypothetical protein